MNWLVDWIYNNPSWLWGSVFVGASVIGACVGLLVFDRAVGKSWRKTHNDVTGIMVQLIGVVYAVLLAFIAVATWETLSSSTNVVQQEAGYVDNLYRDSQGFPEDFARTVRQLVREYADTVIKTEWPEQRSGDTPTDGWQPLDRLHLQLVTFRPANQGEAVVQAEFLRALNELYQARTARLTAVSGHVPTVIWWIIVLGGALAVGSTFFFGFQKLWVHLVLVGLFSASLMLVIVMIVALDWPFRGEVSVPADAYINVERGWEG